MSSSFPWGIEKSEHVDDSMLEFSNATNYDQIDINHNLSIQTVTISAFNYVKPTCWMETT